MAQTAEQKKAKRLARREQRKALTSTGWKELKGEIGAVLPENACWHKSKYDTDPKGTNIFQYGGGWVEAHYRGLNPETATEWIVVTDNGGAYKVDAEYMVWHPNGSKACWSEREVKRTIKELMLTGVTRKDPNYRT